MKPIISRMILPLFTISILMSFAMPAHAQFGLDRTKRYDENTYLGTHNSYSNHDEGYTTVAQNQNRSITRQLNAGVRYLNLDLWLMRQKKVALNWQARIYNNNGDSGDTICCTDFSDSDAPRRVVVAHDPYDWFWTLIEGAGVSNRFKYLKETLADISEWLLDDLDNSNAVVTLGFENKVPADYQNLIEEDIEESRLANHIFYLDRPNVGMPAPDGYERRGWWDVRKHGFPTLDYMIQFNKRVVLLPDDGRKGRKPPWLFQVNTVFGDDSLKSDTWAKQRGESSPIDDFTRPLFLMEHAPDLGWLENYNGKNDLSVLKDKWNDIKDRWSRLPHYVTCDYFDRGKDVFSNDGGPRSFVSFLNDERNDLPAIHAVCLGCPAPNAFGWYNSFVTLTPSGTGDHVRKVIYNSFRDTPDSISGMPGELGDMQPILMSIEGKRTFSFAVIGPLGNRSDQVLKDIWIDLTPPTIEGSVDRPANNHGWYNRAVTANFTYRDPALIPVRPDEVSGIDPAASTPAITLSAEGANQVITGIATDRASNQTSLPISGINIDMTNPTVTYSGNLGTYTVDQFINVTCRAFDSLSGVFSNTCRDVTGDAYNFPLGTNTFSAIAVDNADNLGSGAMSFAVEVTVGSLSNLTRRFVTNAGVANSLTQKLRATGDAAARGDLNGKAHHIDVFVHELDNQTPRFITPANAAILVRLARAL